MKKKTYVLMISDVFPQTHKRKGEPTYFPGKILDEIKIHTIRSNYDLWEKRVKEINEGRAVLSVRIWFDKPYRSPQIEVTEFDKVGIEKLTFPSNEFSVRFVNGNPCFAHAEEIGENDGLTLDDFFDWFKGYDLSKPMAIIHFTDFRYKKPEEVKMEYTGEEYDKKLYELARKAGVDSILAIPGVHELVSENLNNEIIKAIENEI